MGTNQLTELIGRAVGELSRNEFCRKADISAGNFSRIMRGQRPTPEVLFKIARVSNRVQYGELMRAAGYIEAREAPDKACGIPIYGSIAAGTPIEAFENLSGYIKLEYEGKPTGKDCFALRVVGDSMDMANIPDASVVVIQRMADLKNGGIGAVMVNGEVTVKRFYNKGTHIVLVPVSSKPEYQPQIFFPGDDIKILGKVVMSVVNID